ncbi:MAG TPA: DUF3866 family protein [Firmicutes bacterium]|nr:DUF3866 family protein [Bacillota bacterium]
MISLEKGTVHKICWERKGMQCLEVSLPGRSAREKALNYTCLSGKIEVGQGVHLNTTAVKLGLGSGGYHFVLPGPASKTGGGTALLQAQGHIIKLRYTPLQLRVKTYEEILAEKHPDRALSKYPGLGNTPVVIGELHSMVAPFVLSFSRKFPTKRIVYIMTDTASLPLHLSKAISRLESDHLLAGTITCGHAFGGDLETVNVYSALMAAKEELAADVILLVPGPGVVGTATRYGFSGIEQGEHIDRVNNLKGVPVFIPRISFADKRSRHYGLSHHSITSLEEIALTRACLPLPIYSKNKRRFLFRQLKEAGLPKKHRLVLIKQPPLQELEHFKGLETMGRNVKQDPEFFTAINAAAFFTGKLLKPSFTF